MALKDEFVDFHATLVAQQMIGTGALTSGVSPGAALQSFGLSDQNDDSLVALGLNRLATLNSGQVRAINLSFVAVPGFFDAPDGNSYFTQFVDWSAQRHDVLYVVAWGNADELELVRKPADNFNGITVASSEQVGEDGPYRRFSMSTNFFEDDPSDAQRIDILAPGTNVPVTGWDENLSFVGGSSFAAPTVVGTVALMQQYAQIQRNLPTPNPRFDSDSERHQVMKASILNSADKIADVHGSERTVWNGADKDWEESVAFASPFVALDPEMGAGHLNAKRAVEQLMPGEYDPGMIPKNGWDYHTIGGGGASNEYFFEDEIGGYIAVTLAWDRQTTHTQTCGVGTFCEGDQFFTGTLDETANDLDIRILPANSNDFGDAVAASLGSDDTLEHIFFDIPNGMYKIVVTNSNISGKGEADTYALAWWNGNAPSLSTPGDYDQNGSVGPEDYDVWKTNFGTNFADADGNGNGIVDAADYTVWRDNFGAGGGSLAAVPEPSGMMLLAVAGVLLGWRKREKPASNTSAEA